MFVIGGAVSIWEGIDALLHPPELEAFWAGVIVLTIAIVLDGLSRTSPSASCGGRAAARACRCVSCWTRARPDRDHRVLRGHRRRRGASLALVALILHRVTGSAVPDAIATLLIGALLTYVAVSLTAATARC